MTSSPSITPGSTGAAPGASYLIAGAPAAGASWLLACGAVAGPLFVTTVLVQAVTRPGFDLTRDAASLLDNGSWGWIQVVNFIVTGLLFIVAGAGLRRALNGGRGSRWAPRLLIITGTGCIGGGIFHPDPSGGFPPGTPPGASAVSSWHGTLHLICGSAAFLALIVFCIVVARRYWSLGQRRTAACSSLAGVLCAAGVATGGIPHGSLTLFIGVAIAMLWVAYVSIQLRAQHAA